MYKKNQNRKYQFTDFNQPVGLKMDPENRWVKKAAMILWDAIEEKYAELFPSDTGNPAKPVRVALGALLIQKQYGYADRELVEQIRENPYYQYLIGLPGYQQEQPFTPSLLVAFRKRLTDDLLDEINEMIIEYNQPDDPDPGDGNPPDGGGSGSGSDSGIPSDTSSGTNEGTLILDATCAPQHIAFPQDINLLNEAREKLEGIIDAICFEYHLQKPRTYRINARKDYLALAKCRKRTSNRIHKAIRQQLQYIRRDIGYIYRFLTSGKEISTKHRDLLKVILKVYEQQQYMYTNRTHSVVDRIEVERDFSLAKRCYGLGMIVTRLEETTRCSISLSIIAMNLDQMARLLFDLIMKLVFNVHGAGVRHDYWPSGLELAEWASC